MKKNFLKFICKFGLLFSFLFLQMGCALFTTASEAEPTLQQSTDYLKAEALVLNREYEKSLPFLIATLVKVDADYDRSLLLSARSYDQLAQPEKVILATQELLMKPIDLITEMRARSLLLKNFAKAKTDIRSHLQKKIILNWMQNKPADSIVALESLNWSMDFVCDQYCAEEIEYFKEIQLLYLYIIEAEDISAERAAEIIISRYQFFHSFLRKEHLSLVFRKKIAMALIDSLNKFENSQLTALTGGAVRAATVARKLSQIEKNTESWLYQ